MRPAEQPLTVKIVCANPKPKRPRGTWAVRGEDGSWTCASCGKRAARVVVS